MPLHDLVKTDARIRSTILTINAAGLQLHGRRSDLTDQGLRAEWEKVVNKHSPAIEELAAEVEAIAAAVDNIHGYEVEKLLPAVPDKGLTAAQELAVARLLARPGVYELESLPTVIRPHLETPLATILVEEIQARNHNVDDDYITAVLAQESPDFAQAMRVAREGRYIVGVLRQGVEELRKALDFKTAVNASPMNNPHRPGVHLPSLQDMYGQDVKFKITHIGNIHL